MVEVRLCQSCEGYNQALDCEDAFENYNPFLFRKVRSGCVIVFWSEYDEGADLKVKLADIEEENCCDMPDHDGSSDLGGDVRLAKFYDSVDDRGKAYQPHEDDSSHGKEPSNLHGSSNFSQRVPPCQDHSLKERTSERNSKIDWHP